jgi:hypothetical protein
MKFSEKIDKIFPAFVKAQSEFMKATKDSTNPFFNSKYADLNAYLDGSAEGLKDNDLAIIQDSTGSPERHVVSVSTLIVHSSGQWIQSEPLTMIPTDNKPQTYGSCLTYCRRYSLSTMLSMGASDDDGNRASKTPKLPKRAEMNKELSNLTSLEEFKSYARNFVETYGAGVWSMPSGHTQKKGETVQQLFETHKNRLSGVPPVNANQKPEDLVSEFLTMVENCGDAETYQVISDMYDNNPALQVNQCTDAFILLQNDLTERGIL